MTTRVISKKLRGSKNLKIGPKKRVEKRHR